MVNRIVVVMIFACSFSLHSSPVLAADAIEPASSIVVARVWRATRSAATFIEKYLAGFNVDPSLFSQIMELSNEPDKALFESFLQEHSVLGDIEMLEMGVVVELRPEERVWLAMDDEQQAMVVRSWIIPGELNRRVICEITNRPGFEI